MGSLETHPEKPSFAGFLNRKFLIFSEAVFIKAFSDGSLGTCLGSSPRSHFREKDLAPEASIRSAYQGSLYLTLWPGHGE